MAMAPFLGRPDLIEEITRAGGLARWTDEQAQQDDHARLLWQWLRGSLSEQSRPELYLAFGDGDTFAPAQRLLAASLSRHVSSMNREHIAGPRGEDSGPDS